MSGSRRLVVVGGVAAGLSAAARARRMDAGLDILVFERTGFCSYSACGLPYLVAGVVPHHTALVARTPEDLGKEGIEVRLHHQVEGVDVTAGRVRVRNLETGRELQEPYDELLLATGGRAKLPFPGMDLPGVFLVRTVEDGLAIREWIEVERPERAVIVGGGYIALELGQMFHRFGSQVTILERSQKILKDYEPEVSLAVTEALRSEGVNLVTGVAVRRVLQEGDEIIVVAERSGLEQRFRAQRLLVATGRAPNTDGIGLDKVRVELDDRGFVPVSDQLRTNVPYIWAAGDVIGRFTGSQLATPVGAHDGGIAASNALNGERRAVDHAVIPRTIFTDPQVAVVGLTDAEAIGLGHRCWCNTIPVELVPRAGAVRDTRGIAKMVIDADTDQVLGVSLVMRDAGEVIHEAAMGLRLGAKIHDFIELVHVYPTMAEALKIVAISRYKDPHKLSCCAE